MILDLFAGPGGWSEGLRMAGLSDIGIEWDKWACLTRRAAGHRTIRADVSQYPTEPFRGRVSGLIASPPCQAWSMAGRGDGRADIAHVHRAVEACRSGWVQPDRGWIDERTPLVLEPLRWAWDIRPLWIACEQVPPVMPLWEHMADVLRAWGYSAVAVALSAEQYGVPQTRERVFLLAHRKRPVTVPGHTHQRYQNGVGQGAAQECETSLFGPGLLPWVSMADALGWGPTRLDRRQNGAPVIEDVSTRPCPTMTGASIGAGVWALRAGTNANDVEREADEPAATLRFGGRLNTVGWVRTSFGEPHRGKDVGSPSPEFDPRERPCRTVCGKTADWSLRMGLQDNATTRPAPAPALVVGHQGADIQWVHDRPATSVVGSFRPDIIAAPGYRTEVSRQDAEGSVRIRIDEAAVLQGFRPDYPWQGPKTAQFQQCGNAVCPPVAAAVVTALASI